MFKIKYKKRGGWLDMSHVRKSNDITPLPSLNEITDANQWYEKQYGHSNDTFLEDLKGFKKYYKVSDTQWKAMSITSARILMYRFIHKFYDNVQNTI